MDPLPEKLTFVDMPSLASFSQFVPAEPKKKNKKADKSSKNTRAVGKEQEEKETHNAWANAMVMVEDQADKAVAPGKNQSVGMDEVKSQVTNNAATSSAKDVYPTSINPVESKKEPTSVNAKRTSAEDLQSRSNSTQQVQPVSKEPVESKEESITVQITEDLQGASLTTANDDGKQGIQDAAADSLENQSDVAETKQNEDTWVTVQRFKAATLAGTETAKRRSTTVRMTDELADEALMTPIKDKHEIPDSTAREKENKWEVIEVQQHKDNAQPHETSSADTPHVRPLESKEESSNFQTADEVADKALMKPKNDGRKQEMWHEDNAEVTGSWLITDAPNEVRILEERRVRFETPENAESKTEEDEKLEDKGAEPLVKIKEPDGYEPIKFDVTYEPDNNIEALHGSFSNSLSSSLEPLNPDEPNCGGPRSSLLSDTPEPQSGTIFRMRPVLALLATVAIASVIFGFYSFLQQRK